MIYLRQKKYISPKMFKKIIGQLNPLFEGYYETDAKDLMLFIIDKLHQELNKVDYSKQFNKDFNQLDKDLFNEQKMFEHFIIFLKIIY